MTFAFIINLTILLGALFKTKNETYKQKLLSPSIIVSLFIIFYCIIGVNLYWKGNYYALGKDYQSSLDTIYLVISIFSITFFASQLLSYKLFKIRSVNDHLIGDLKDISGKLLITYTTIVILIAFLGNMSESNTGVNNFFMLLFNSLIPIIGILTVSNFKKYFPYLLAYTFLSTFFGFRYRLVLLYFPIFFYIIWSNKQNLKKVILFTLIFTSILYIIAVVGVTRKYSSGLQLDSLKNLDFVDVLIGGLFNDTGTVLVTGSFIELMDSTGKFSHINQIIYILEYFIPSSLLKNKSYSPVLEYVSYTVGDWVSGAAILGFGEYYHTGGMIGVILFATAYATWLTFLYKRSVISKSSLHVFYYFSMLAWLINSFTRGYLPQNFQELLSLLIGFHIMKKLRSNHKIKQLHYP